VYPRSSLTGEVCDMRGSSFLPHFAPYNLVGTYQEELHKLKSLLMCTAAFAFVRYNDGERDAIRGTMPWKRIYKGLDAAKAKQFQTTNDAIKQLSDDLLHVLQFQDSRFIIALPIPSCAEGLVDEYKSGGGNRRFLSYFSFKQDGVNVTRQGAFHPWSYSTLFSHRGGRALISFMQRIFARNNTVVVANQNVRTQAQRKKLSWAARVETFPSNLPQVWTGDTRQMWLNKAKDLAAPGGRVIVVALGTVSKVIIHEMFQHNPQNSYIDIGSLIDGLIGVQSRAWLSTQCQKLGRYCTETRWTIKHDMGPCPERGECTLPAVPHFLGRKNYQFKTCKDRRFRNKPGLVKCDSVSDSADKPVIENLIGNLFGGSLGIGR